MYLPIRTRSALFEDKNPKYDPVHTWVLFLEEVIMWLEIVLLGLGLGFSLAMDAFSVSLANGLNEPNMKKCKLLGVAGVFAGFQFLMPMLGWVFVSFFVNQFKAFEKFIPWIALALLGFIGGKMLYEGIKSKGEECEKCAVGFWALIVQGVATSIDALSSGFAIDVPVNEWYKALVCCAIIGVLTFFICIAGLLLGKKFGTKLAGKASVFGGVILIIIGIWIFIKGLLGL